MAKRKDTTTASDQTTRGSATPAADTVEQRLVAFAEQLGRIIGTVQARADGWLDRRALDEELTRIRDGAADLLDHVGSGAAASSSSERHPLSSVKSGRAFLRLVVRNSPTSTQANFRKQSGEQASRCEFLRGNFHVDTIAMPM